VFRLRDGIVYVGWDALMKVEFSFLARLSERCRIMNLMLSLYSFDTFGRLFDFVVLCKLITS